MCGILWLVNRNSNINQDSFIQMLNTLDKRWPNQSGVFFENNIALGHRRLSIIDLSDNWKQPMFNDAWNIILVFNWEIYNYSEIKSNIMENYHWKSKTDSEVLLHGYETYWLDIVNHLNGMFAFAVYDKNKQTIVLSRDHFWKKPLYYYIDDDFFCFSSEIKSIIKNIEIKKRLKIDQESLLKYLFYWYVPSPNSIFDKLKKLQPSHILEFDIKNWKITRNYEYWNLWATKIIHDYDESYILDRTEDLIKKAINKRLMSDVPLWLFLSGWVDSWLIAYYLSSMKKDLNAYTVNYIWAEFSETSFSKRISSGFNIRHHICDFDNNKVLENFVNILNYIDEPMADTAILPLYFVSRFAANQIKVVLSGDWWDEVFWWYPKYVAQKFINDYWYLKYMMNLLKYFVPKSNKYHKLFDWFNMPFSARQFIFWSWSFLTDDIKLLLNIDQIDLNGIFNEANLYLEKVNDMDIINKSLYLDCKIQLPDWYFVKWDRATMANSIEMRNPLVDKDLVEFAFSLPWSYKIRNWETKYILKKLASRYIDKDIIYRKKSWFWSPIRVWINNELRDLFEEYLFIDNWFFNLDVISKLYFEHKSLKIDNSFKLLRIFNFNYWYKRYYE